MQNDACPWQGITKLTLHLKWVRCRIPVGWDFWMCMPMCMFKLPTNVIRHEDQQAKMVSHWKSGRLRNTRVVSWTRPLLYKQLQTAFSAYLNWSEHSVPRFVSAAAEEERSISVCITYFFSLLTLHLRVCLCVCGRYETAMTHSWRPKMWSPEISTVVAVKLESIFLTHTHTYSHH